jgi:hypothetical protein
MGDTDGPGDPRFTVRLAIDVAHVITQHSSMAARSWNYRATYSTSYMATPKATVRGAGRDLPSLPTACGRARPETGAHRARVCVWAMLSTWSRRREVVVAGTAAAVVVGGGWYEGRSGCWCSASQSGSDAFRGAAGGSARSRRQGGTHRRRRRAGLGLLDHGPAGPAALTSCGTQASLPMRSSRRRKGAC